MRFISFRGPLRLAVALFGVLAVGGLAVANTVEPAESVAPASAEAPTPAVAARDAGPVPTTTSAPSTTSTTVAPTTTLPPTTTTTLPVFDPDDREPGWEQRRGEAALARIAFDPAALGWEIRFLPERPGYYGMTYRSEQRIDIWVRPDQSLDLLTHVVAHEMGHAVDLTWNDDARRNEYLQLRGLGSRSWFTCDGCTDFSTPAGDFAEVFAYWAVGQTDFRSTLGPPPSPEQYPQLERFFAPPA